MTPERWQQVKDIFNSAVKYRPEERSVFLTKACDGDGDLRSEVESLIASHEKNESFIDAPPYEAIVQMLAGGQRSIVGQTIGNYVVLSKLGEGGMAAVYLARDSRLGRQVALKILPAFFNRDLDRLRRFEQEARAGSALNHPNILTVHEIGEIGENHFIATEFVEGETLRDRLTLGRLPIGEALNITEQIASALCAAHAKGILHRDIKPGNVMLRPDSLVKVLDFGLAKLIGQSERGTDEATAALAHTQSGMIIGTVTYMSPEQTRGLAVDARTDIWSLGVVLYEMLTGRPPFLGSTQSDVMVSVLERDAPPLAEHLPHAPDELQSILTKMLCKDPEARYQAIADLQVDLRNLKLQQEQPQTRSSADFGYVGPLEKVIASTTYEGEITRGSGAVIAETEGSDSGDKWLPTAELPAPAATLSPLEKVRRHRLAAVVTLVVLSGVAFGLYKLLISWRTSQSDVAKTGAIRSLVVRTMQLTSWAGLDLTPSFSPDGSAIAYCSDQNGSLEIYVKQLAAGGREIQITLDGQQNLEPAWSPSGKLIAYHSKNRGGIWLIPALGGVARQLTEFGSYPAWSPDGTLIAFQSAGIGDSLLAIGSGAVSSSTIWVVALSGGAPKQISQPANTPGSHGSPTWSPDGKWIAFATYDLSRQSEVWSVSADGSRANFIVRNGLGPVYAPDGQSIYFIGNPSNLGYGVWQAPISTNQTGSNSEPVKLLDAGAMNIKHLSVAADGKRIAYGALSQTSNLWSVRLSASSEAVGPPAALTRELNYRSSAPAVSPDGGKIAYNVYRAGGPGGIWVINANGTNPTQVAENGVGPSWSPDGQQILFSRQRAGRATLWSIPLSGGKEERLIDLGPGSNFLRISPDGKQVVFNSTTVGATNLWLASVAGGSPKQLTFDLESMGFACWSPDGKMLALGIKRGEDGYIGLMPSSGGEVKQLNFDHGVSAPNSWSPDGDKIAFAGARNGIWNVYWISRTNEQRKMTNYTKLNLSVRYPAWSPQGDRIIYEYTETTGNIWLMELK